MNSCDIYPLRIGVEHALNILQAVQTYIELLQDMFVSAAGGKLNDNCLPVVNSKTFQPQVGY